MAKKNKGLVHRITQSAHYRYEKALMCLLGAIHTVQPSKVKNSSIIIAAYPRGGSTWLSQLLSCADNSVVMYEPLLPLIKQGVIPWRQFLSKEDHHPALEQYLSDLFSGKKLSHQVALHSMTANTACELVKADTWIHKFCRLQSLLPWLTHHFNIPAPIFLVRNPYATIASQLIYGSKKSASKRWKELHSLNYLNANDNKGNQKMYAFYKNKLDSLHTTEENLAALWCLSHIPGIAESQSRKWTTITYEELLTDGKKIMPELFHQYQLPYDHQRLEDVFHTRSATSLKEGAKINIDQQITGWKDQLSANQVRLIRDTLKKFNMDFFTQNDIITSSDLKNQSHHVAEVSY